MPKKVLRIPGKVAVHILHLILLLGIGLLLISFITKVASDRLLQQHPRHAKSLKLIGIMDAVTPKLETAEKALTDYSEQRSTGKTGSHVVHHWADPRESAGCLKWARKNLARALGSAAGQADGELQQAHREVGTLIEKLGEVDIVRGEGYYNPLRLRIAGVRRVCESKAATVRKSIPRGLLAKSTRLRKEGKITLIAGGVLTGVGLLMWWKWMKFVKKSRRLRQSHELAG